MELEKQAESKPARDELGRLLPGNTANPNGRPKGKTLKEFAREYYELKTVEEKIAYLEKLEEKRPGFAWEMAEGRPPQKLEGDKDNPLFVIPNSLYERELARRTGKDSPER